MRISARRAQGFSSLLGASIVGMVVAAVPALASDGVLEINQACAIETGCFPGDAAGFPVELAEAGAYRLTGNLTLAGNGSPIGMLQITSDDVDVDLNGFSIRCTGPGGNSCSGSTHGVVGSRNNISIRNGSISDMPGSGIRLSGSSLRAERIQAIRNGGAGIWLGGEVGILGGALHAGNVARNSLAALNGDEGIVVGGTSFIRGSIVRANTGTGILGRFTQVAPFSLEPLGGYLENVIERNGVAVSGLVDMGSNLCSDCP